MIRSTILSAIALTLLGTGFIWPAIAQAEDGITYAADDVVVLAEGEGTIRLPRGASGEFSTTIAWAEADEAGRLRIRSATLNDGQLRRSTVERAVATIDQTVAGDNGWPDVAVNPVSRRPGIVWINIDGSSSSLLFREGRADTEAIAATENLFDLPTIVYDAEGNAYVAWTETVGSTSRTRVAIRSTEGDWEERPIPFGERPYELFPQLFATDEGAELIYYSLQDGDFIAERWGLAPGALLEPLPFPEDIPANRLPILYLNGDGVLGAVWIEQTEFGELYFELAPDQDGIRELRELSDSPQPVAEVALAPGGNGAKIWIEGSPTDRNVLVVAVPGNEGEERLAVTPVAVEPLIALSSNWIHVAWVHEDIAGGTSTLLYRRLPR